MEFNNEQYINLSEKDIEMLTWIYRLRFLTVNQISRAFVNNNSNYTYVKMWRLKSKKQGRCLVRTEPLMDNKVAGRRKITSCYYLTDKAIRALGLGTEPAIRHINKLEQPKRAKQNEFFVEWYLKEWPNWAYLDAREVKAEKNLNRKAHFFAAFQDLSSPSGELNDQSSYQLLYFVSAEPSKQQIIEIQRELIRHAELGFKKASIFFEDKIGYDLFGSGQYNTASLQKLPYEIGVKLVPALGPRKKGLPKIINNILAEMGYASVKITTGPAITFTNKVVKAPNGQERYLVELLTNDTGIRVALQQYTHDVYKTDGRQVAAWALEELKDEYEKYFPKEAYPHITFFYVPRKTLLAALTREEQEVEEKTS